MAMAGLLLIGTVWGTTNAFIKRGALIAEERLRDRRQMIKTRSPEERSLNPSRLLLNFLQQWYHLLCVWEYSIPFVVNLSASILFFRALGGSPINIVVPVTNATTFAVTAVAGAALGENIQVSEAMLGILMIVLGITLCTVPNLLQ